MNYDQDYSRLMDLFVRLVQSQAGTPMTPGIEWLNDGQTLSLKLFQHLVSLRHIADGTTFRSEHLPPVPFIDLGSLNVTARAAFETYLVFFYLYGDADRSLCEFRHKTWKLGGLMDRQEFHASMPESLQIVATEKALIDALRHAICHDAHLLNYTPKQQAKLLDGDWKIGRSWGDLAGMANFHERYFSDVYSYLCAYSHSGYLSAMQIGQARAPAAQKGLSQFSLGAGVVLMAHFAFTYAALFASAEAVLSAADPVTKKSADRWRLGNKDMLPIYGF